MPYFNSLTFPSPFRLPPNCLLYKDLKLNPKSSKSALLFNFYPIEFT